MTNLIDKAISMRPYKVFSGKTKYKYSEEEIKLALAWVNNEVSVADVCRAMGMNVNNRAGAYNFLAICLKKHLNKTLEKE